MKKIIRIIINKLGDLFATNDISKIKSRISKYEYVSFDIFDTLISRKCGDPKNIFTLVEKKYNSKKGNKTIERYSENRIKTEKETRSNSNKEEITLEEIYENIDYDKAIKRELIKMEIEEEIEQSNLNININEIYKWCIENGKKVIISAREARTMNKRGRKNSISEN